MTFATFFATLAPTSFVVALLAAAGPGCRDAPLEFYAGPPGLDDLVVKQSFQTDLGVYLDLLFVVDDTPAGASLRSTLAAAYPRMAAALQRRNPGIVSLHAGFVAASSGVAAPQSRGLECGLAAPAQYLISESCGQRTNFAGSLEDAFGCLADLATSSQAVTAQPLATLRQTLSGQRDGVPDAGWEGFLRPNAGLLIVVVAGEDDASGGAGTLAAVSDFADFVRGLKADPNLVGVSVIEGADCGDPGAPPVPRLQQFVEAFGESGIYIDSCQADPILAIEWAVTASAVAPPSDCLAGIRDTDLATPGLQAECSVTDAVLTPAGWSPRTPLLSCQIAAPPCYTLAATDLISCPSSSFLLTVDRGPGFCPADTTSTVIYCAACADPNDPACQPAGH